MAETYIDRLVLIKEVAGGIQDRVFEVRNIPKSLLYGEDEKILGGIEVSQTNDGGFVFFGRTDESKTRLANIDRYISGVYPRTRTLPRRIPNAQEPGRSSSNALSRTELQHRFKDMFGVPYVDLPIPEHEIPKHENKSVNQLAAESFKAEDKPVQSRQPDAKTEGHLQCNVCQFVAKNPTALKVHFSRKHKGTHNGLTNNKKQDS
jgi:hypothetical protein